MTKPILEQLSEDGKIFSYAEGRRLIAQGAVFVNGVEVDSPARTVRAGDKIKFGKRAEYKVGDK